MTPVNGKAVAFRFQSAGHTYTAIDTGEVLPSITQMLERCGWVDDAFMTEASRVRGMAVHDLCAAYDLGALDLARVEEEYRGYVHGHITAMQMIPHRWDAIEVPCIHSGYRFCGRPDRVGSVYDLLTVYELKSGAKTKAVGIQLALQAILAAGQGSGLPAESYQRLAEYVKPSGRFVLERFTDERDFDHAYDILRRFAGRAA